jgi:hypothetical protein
LTVEAELAAVAGVGHPEPVKQAATAGDSGQAAPVCPVTSAVKTFTPASPANAGAEQTEESEWPPWLSAYGAAAAALAGLAVFTAAVLAQRFVTIGILAAGLAVTWLGIRATRGKRTTSDIVGLLTGGGLCVLGVLLALFVPAVLNRFWGMDFSVARADPDQQVQVRRTEPREPGRPLSAEEWIDAATAAIRQGDAVIRVEGGEAGPLPGKGDESFLQIRLGLANVGFERYIPFEGFARDKHAPVLSDDTGHTYLFVEQRRRKRGPGPKGMAAAEPVFEAAPARIVHIVPNRSVERLLVFEGSATGLPGKALKLELPAAAWGRRGVCKMRITVPFETAP